jgi:hypothetical protein
MTAGSSSKANTDRSKPCGPGDDHAHSTTKWIGSNPSLVLLFDVPASGLGNSFDPLAGCGRDCLAVENEKGHLGHCANVTQRANGLHDKTVLSLFCHNLSSSE